MPTTLDKDPSEQYTLPLLEISEPAEWDAFRRALGIGSKSLTVRFNGMVVEFKHIASEAKDLIQFLSFGGGLTGNVHPIMARLMRYSGPTNPFNRWKWNDEYPNSLDYLFEDGSVNFSTPDIDTRSGLFQCVIHLGKKSWVGKKDVLTILTLHNERFGGSSCNGGSQL